MSEYTVYRVPIVVIVVAPKNHVRSVQKSVEGACSLLLDCDTPEQHHIMSAYIHGKVRTKDKDPLLDELADELDNVEITENPE